MCWVSVFPFYTCAALSFLHHLHIYNSLIFSFRCRMESCVICQEPLDNGEETVVLRQKGCDGIGEASKLRGVPLTTTVGQSVHKKCRFEYCNKNSISRDLRKKQDNPSTRCRQLRSSDAQFLFSEHCLFCGHPAKYAGKKRGFDVFPVRTGDFQSTIQDVCKKRGDSWAHDVQSRIEYA